MRFPSTWQTLRHRAEASSNSTRLPVGSRAAVMILEICLAEGSKTGAAYSDDGTAVAPDGAWLHPTI